jgi:hypothetical protein
LLERDRGKKEDSQYGLLVARFGRLFCNFRKKRAVFRTMVEKKCNE